MFSMNHEKITINGLLDGISVLENNNTSEVPYVTSDIIYNENEPISFSINEENSNV